MKRRTFLASSLGLLASGQALALGDASKVDVVELDIAGSLSRPGAWLHMLYEIDRVSSVEVADEIPRIPPSDLGLFDHPFAVLTGDRGFDELADEEIELLTRYIRYGGFLYIDDATGSDQAGDFDRSVRRMLGRMFPTRPLVSLDADHSLYRAFFFIRKPVGRVAVHGVLEGVQLGQITPIVYGRNDLSGALERTASGKPLHPVVPGGDYQRREAGKLSVNLMLYALTSNYKKDQAHV
ncbi:MAG: DUF4159 domain-containing protein, partial [Proteobacteria bacterium]|nr:DUF4159 domain-containing protein [Pseudomonadota bacterium]